jgi:phosphatidate cytidylyltransferase
MTMPRESWMLFAGVIAVLLLASATGAVLAARAGPTPNPSIENLNARIKAWWVMVLLISPSCSAKGA